jgi:alpha-tubulin suppressor-like RCC1 family protein
MLLVIVTGSCGKDAAAPTDELRNPEFYASPVEVSPELTFVQVGAGSLHTCGVTTDGAAWCWGWNDYGALGTTDSMDTCGDALDGPLGCSGVPLPVSGGRRFVGVFPALRHTCGLADGGTAFCWGVAFALGRETPDGVLPAPVAGEHRFTVLSTSLDDEVTCGLVADGQAYCWGADYPNRGGLGTGSTGHHQTPVAVARDLRFVSLSVGQFHTCGVAADGGAWCWGGNWYGQLGIGSAGGAGGTMTLPLPEAVLGDHTFTQIAAAVSHTCGLTAAGRTFCWGGGSAFGGGDRYVHTPIAVDGGIALASIHTGGNHTCGLTSEGVAYCWGQNEVGQLGDGSTEYRGAPTPVSGGMRFSMLTAGGGHTCALTIGGRAYCWGGNPYGQVGRPGSLVDSLPRSSS